MISRSRSDRVVAAIRAQRSVGRLLAVAALAGVGVAIGEIALFLVVVRAVGTVAAGVALVGASVLGAVALRREGVRGWRRWRAALEQDRPVGLAATDGLVGLGAALLLLVPGFATAVLGALLLVPGVRSGARWVVRRLVERRVPSRVAGDLFGPRRVRVGSVRPGSAGGSSGPGVASGEDVVEGEVMDGPSSGSDRP